MLQLSPLPNPPRAPGPRSPQAQFPGHRGDEACDAGRAAGRRVVGAADAVVLDGLAAKTDEDARDAWGKNKTDIPTPPVYLFV